MNEQVKELWRTIPFNTSYEVSVFGRVRRKVRSRNRFAGYIITPKLENHGYYRIKLWDDGERWYTLHRVILETFRGEAPPGKPLGLHNDGNPLNCRLSNLRWGSWWDNWEDARKHGTLAIGDNHPHAKLIRDEASYIKSYYAFGISQRELAREFGVSRGAIQAILRGRTWA